MTPSRILKGCLIALAAFGTFHELKRTVGAVPAQADVEEGVEVLTRGPVHEAFAETISFDPEPGIIVGSEPPEAIEEIAPEQRPEGDNVAWIPGYWAWDDEREDFLWVSGIWRDLPPGRQWIPGYWTEVDGGFQWISGYWADASLTEIEYLPEPPASEEVGPNIAAPSHDHIWLPGCWVWQETRYAWRPGYWVVMQPDWDWVPAHYVCSPRGYVFVSGYYDHAVSRRGVLFAPVYLQTAVYSRRGYSYSPSVVIDLRWFTAHLFARPHYHHYYFGDYYANSYSSVGFYPSFSYASSGFGYDPFFARQRWNNRDNRDWQRHLERDFANRRDHEDQRPARTLADMIQRNRNASQATDNSLNIAMPLDQMIQDGDIPQRFRPVEQDERRALSERRQEMQKFRNERKQLEAEAREQDPDASTNASKPVRLRLPKSPLVATAPKTADEGSAAPRTPDAPRIDPDVVAKPRAPREGRSGRETADGAKRGPRTDAGPPSAKKSADPGSKSRQKGDRNSKTGQTDPEPDTPTVDQKPGVPGVPRPDRPKGESRPKGGRKDPTPNAPKVAPKAKGGKGEPRPEVPKVDPKPDKPRADPQPGQSDPPKTVPPKVAPQPRPGNAEPKPGVPKADPKPNPPKGESPKVAPSRPPKVDSPKAPKVDPPKEAPPKPPKP